MIIINYVTAMVVGPELVVEHGLVVGKLRGLFLARGKGRTRAG